VPPRPIWESGVVSAVTATSVTVTDHKGTPSTFTITPTTTFAEGKTTVPATNLVVGSHVAIEVSASALMTALSIQIVPPRPICVSGVVTAVSATSVTVTDHKGTAETFSITSTTTFAEGKTTVPATDLVVGDNVQIKAAASAATTATSINIALSRVVGKVTAISGDTITVEGLKGASSTIVTSSTTTFSKAGSASALTDVVVGDSVSAQGLIGATPTTLDASSVSIVGPWTMPGHIALGRHDSNSRGNGSYQSSSNQGFGQRGSSKHGSFRR
jgi:hypothetical protein